eukprot:1487286-Prymnesium_polylepis.2
MGTTISSLERRRPAWPCARARVPRGRARVVAVCGAGARGQRQSAGLRQRPQRSPHSAEALAICRRNGRISESESPLVT